VESTRPVNRRQFLTDAGKVAAVASVGLTAASAKRVLGANERMRVGVIGPGLRGFNVLIRGGLQRIDNVDLVAVADIYEGWRERGIEAAQLTYEKAKGYDHYKKLLDAKDKDKLDAVVIATPEHSHCRMVLDALDAGFDVYCEKPMTHTVEEAKQVVAANKKANRIIQVGTQRRSIDVYQQAAKIAQAGQIGKITQVRAFWYRNSKNDSPQWRYYIPEEASEKNLNWKEFLGTAPDRPFDPKRYFQWRCYWDYSMGIASDLMIHQVDATNMVLGSTAPKSVFAMGSTLRWTKDLDPDRETPDTWNTLIDYGSFQFNYSSCFSNEHYELGEQFLGTDGTIEIEKEGATLRVFPEAEKIRSIAEVPELEVRSKDPNGAKSHLENFLGCCRTRKRPNCTEVDGYYGVIAAHMAVRSFFEGKRVTWDAENEVEVV